MRKYIILLLVAIVAVILWKYIPYNDTVTEQITKALEKQGFKVTSLKLESLDAGKAVISDIRLSGEKDLTVKKVIAEYSLKKLAKGKFNTLRLEDIEINIYKKDKWNIGGIESLLNSQKEESKETDIFKLLPERFEINNADINIGDKAFINDLVIKADFSKASGKGTITSPDIIIKDTPEEIPPLQLDSEFSLTPELAEVKINIHNKSKKWLAKADINYPLKDKQNAVVNIKMVGFPWGKGRIFTDEFSVPLSMDKPISFVINLKDVDLTELLGKVAEGKISGQGKISGKIPLIYNPDGSIILKKGSAYANDSGLISVSPSLIPGDNDKLVLTRQLLENFHYTKLKISVSSDKDEKSVITLSLEGGNPDSEEKRPVKLNVNLSGDIISLLRQSLIPFNDPQEYLK